MTALQTIQDELRARPRVWLVTGSAGFIGSNILEHLLNLGQQVRGLDNFATGSRQNPEEVRLRVAPAAWERFQFLEGDIRKPEDCLEACTGVDFVLHQAALGSVPRSIEDPFTSYQVNMTGTLNMLEAARKARVRRLVYASSSSVYGDHPRLPKIESELGKLLSPYAATKLSNEMFANVFHQCYGLEVIGLRYFNVFGPRQDPDGPYAAVIPKWIDALLRGQPIQINGDGETSRDFCYVANVVQANLLAAAHAAAPALGRAFNVALNERTTLNELFRLLREMLSARRPELAKTQPVYGPFRAGDVAHSQADISLAREHLGFIPTHSLRAGLENSLEWYVAHTPA